MLSVDVGDIELPDPWWSVLMKSQIKNWILAMLFVASTGGVLVTTALPQTASAACATSFFGIPAWYDGLVDGECKVKAPDAGQKGLSTFIWRIALNIVRIILLAAGYLSATFIIVGGFKYITSAGSPDGSVKARKTILNAVIGLVISIFSVAVVNVITTVIGGTIDQATGLPMVAADSTTLTAILNTVYFWAGVIAVIMVIVGGLLYAISGGNSSNVTKAKDTIIYSVVGLIVVIVAFTITQVVIGRF